MVTYFCPPTNFHNIRAKYFTIGHALELYLKAFYYKNTDDWKDTVKFSHNIWNLLEACQNIDSTLLSKYEFKKEYYDLISNYGTMDHLKPSDLSHITQNGEFYQICKYEGDLKYLGLPRKKTNSPDAFGINVPNKYWAKIFGEIRRKLEFPPEKCQDSLQIIFSDPKAPPILIKWIDVILNEASGDGLPFVSSFSLY